MAKYAYFQHPERPGSVIRTENPEYWGKDDGYVRLPQKLGEAEYINDARARLLEKLKPGDTVYIVLRSVARSGMSRGMGLFVVEDGKVVPITHAAATVTGASTDKNGALVIGGCGFDAGFEAVYRLGGALWPEGTPSPHSVRNGEPDYTGGYALKHVWL